MSLSRDALLLEMGIRPLWRLRQPLGTVEPVAPEPLATEAAITPPVHSPPPRPPTVIEASPALAAETAIPLATPVAPVAPTPKPVPVITPAAPPLPAPDFPPAVPDDAQPAFADGPPDFDLPPDDFFPPELSGHWQRDWEAVGQHEDDSPQDPERLPRHERIALLDWAGLEQGVAECRACGLCQQRTQAVLGVGDRKPVWLLIGEGPGQEEDLKGEPFVGQAGKLLDAMLAALELKRGDKVYIANAVKCRPPGNRTPTPEEMAFCRPFLKRQIQLLQPQVIVLLGKAAVQTMLDEHGALGALRGKRFEHQGIPVAVTYHPAYLLRNLPDKAKAWADLLFARRLLRQAMQAPAPARLP